jgi:hypothetical protein
MMMINKERRLEILLGLYEQLTSGEPLEDYMREITLLDIMLEIDRITEEL